MTAGLKRQIDLSYELQPTNKRLRCTAKYVSAGFNQSEGVASHIYHKDSSIKNKADGGLVQGRQKTEDRLMSLYVVNK